MTFFGNIQTIIAKAQRIRETTLEKPLTDILLAGISTAIACSYRASSLLV